MELKCPARAWWPVMALGVIALCASEPVLAQQSPAAQRGLTFVRVNCAQCHAIDRVMESPARDRAALPHAAPQIPDRKPATAAGRGDHRRPSHDAAVPARTRSGCGCHRLPEDAGTLKRLNDMISRRAPIPTPLALLLVSAAVFLAAFAARISLVPNGRSDRRARGVAVPLGTGNCVPAEGA